MRTDRKTVGRIYSNPARSSFIQFSTLLIFCLGLFFLGCQKDSDLSNVIQKSAAPPDVELEPVSPLVDLQEGHNSNHYTIGGCDIVFSYEYDSRARKTKFCYTVTCSGQYSIEVELPSCAGTPSGYSGGNPTIDNSGGTPFAEWHPSTSSSPREFCVIYDGMICKGLVEVAVFRGGQRSVELLPGACARTFDISGRLFADANANGQPDNEAGIYDKTVFLIDSEGSTIEKTTDQDGNYHFECVPQGNYTVEVIAEDVVGDTDLDFLQATTATSYSFTLDANKVFNFGFETKSELLTSEMKFGNLKTNALSVNYWKGQFQKALNGRPDDFTIEDLADLIDDRRAGTEDINHFGLPDPFNFSTGQQGVQEVYDILRTRPSKDIDALRAELLANELNHFDDRGFLNVDRELQEVMILYLEGVLANTIAGSASSLTLKSSTSAAAVSSTTLSRSIDMSRTFNSGGGGGDH